MIKKEISQEIYRADPALSRSELFELHKSPMHFKPTDIVVLTVSGRGDKDMETYLKFRG